MALSNDASAPDGKFLESSESSHDDGDDDEEWKKPHNHPPKKEAHFLIKGNHIAKIKPSGRSVPLAAERNPGDVSPRLAKSQPYKDTIIRPNLKTQSNSQKRKGKERNGKERNDKKRQAKESPKQPNNKLVDRVAYLRKRKLALLQLHQVKEAMEAGDFAKSEFNGIKITISFQGSVHTVSMKEKKTVGFFNPEHLVQDIFDFAMLAVLESQGKKSLHMPIDIKLYELTMLRKRGREIPRQIHCLGMAGLTKSMSVLAEVTDKEIN